MVALRVEVEQVDIESEGSQLLATSQKASESPIRQRSHIAERDLLQIWARVEEIKEKVPNVKVRYVNIQDHKLLQFFADLAALKEHESSRHRHVNAV